MDLVLIRGSALAMPCLFSEPLRNGGVGADGDPRLCNLNYSLVLLPVLFFCGHRESLGCSVGHI